MEKMMFLKRFVSLSQKIISRKALMLFVCVLMIAPSLPGGLLSVNAETEDLPVAGQNFDQYTPLKDIYKDYFLIGTTGSLTGVRSDLIDYHFNSYTPENEMKPQSVQNVKGTFTFDKLDKLLKSVDDLPGDMTLVGHTLAWHSQSPNWLWNSPDFDREVALENLNNHIDSVFGEYGERLYAMDVVNEAIGSVNPNDPSDWKSALDKGEGWYLALGWEWVELTFVRAAKVIDENGWDCKLYYNDFGLNGTDKAQAVYSMVKDINERYDGHRPNGKPLIEGIGIQGHGNKNTKPEDMEASVKLFATLPGVSLSFTELDVEWPSTGSLTEEDAIAQGQKYAQFFQIFKKYAVGSANQTDNPKVIERVTIWGSNDGEAWKSSSVLFNAVEETTATAKEALVAVSYPDAYLEKHPVAEESELDKYEPINGVYVYDVNRGDAWTGANIILGNNESQWPWSTAGEDGKVAFTPEKDATYRITLNYTSMGTTGIRIRWIKDESNGGYTSQDGQNVGASPHSDALTPDKVATIIPAYFNSGMSVGESYTLVTEIKLDGLQSADSLIGNIAIRGGGGSSNFSIDGLKVEKIGAEAEEDKLLVNWPEGLPKAGTEGIHVYSTEKGDAWTGANIILGNDESQWPWSTAGEDGKVAFAPEKDAEYRVAVNYTALGTTAIRVRWIKDESNGGYTAKDGQVVNEPPHNASLNSNQVSTVIPAYFNAGMVNAGTYTLTTEIKLDGSLPAEDLIGNIAIRGGGGGSNYVINWIKVEKIGNNGEPDQLLVNWPKGIEEQESSTTEPVQTVNEDYLVALAPDAAITRADFLTVLGKLAAVDVSSYKASSFTDVKSTDSYMPYIEWAVKSNIVKGTGNNQFSPERLITREQMAVILVNYASVTSYALTESQPAVDFADDAKISSWAKDVVSILQKAGIINAKDNNLFDPAGNVTGAEAISILQQFVKLR